MKNNRVGRGVRTQRVATDPDTGEKIIIDTTTGGTITCAEFAAQRSGNQYDPTTDPERKD